MILDHKFQYYNQYLSFLLTESQTLKSQIQNIDLFYVFRDQVGSLILEVFQNFQMNCN